MTDKIIIDGVDVSGCDMKCENGECALYYAELNSDSNELEYGFNCSDNPNCYYKQLARKTEELQAEKQKYTDLYDAFCQATKPSPTMTRMNARFNNYEQALKEIKNLADKMKNLSENDVGEITECFFKDRNCDKCSEDKCLTYYFDRILLKCEVLK